VVLSFVPLTGVFTLSLVEDKITEFGSLSILKVTQVDLFQSLIIFIKNSDKTSAIRFAVKLRSMEDRAILEIFDYIWVVSAESHHPCNCFLIALLPYDLKVEVFVSIALHLFDRLFACPRGNILDITLDRDVRIALD